MASEIRGQMTPPLIVHSKRPAPLPVAPVTPANPSRVERASSGYSFDVDIAKWRIAADAEPPAINSLADEGKLAFAVDTQLLVSASLDEWVSDRIALSADGERFIAKGAIVISARRAIPFAGAAAIDVEFSVLSAHESQRAWRYLVRYTVRGARGYELMCVDHGSQGKVGARGMQPASRRACLALCARRWRWQSRAEGGEETDFRLSGPRGAQGDISEGTTIQEGL